MKPLPNDGLEVVRPLLAAALALGFAGTSAELLLIEHTEEFTQIIPLILLAAALVGVLAFALRPTRATVQLFRVLMGLLIGAGVLGVILHYRGNADFELEMRPTMSGFELIRNSMMGATPALAPGSLVSLGLVGLIAAFRHPATRRGRRDPGTDAD